MSRDESSVSFWETRIERANVLAARYPFAAELLGFYAEVAGFQASVAGDLTSRRAVEDGIRPEQVFKLTPPPDELLARFPELLALMQRIGTPALAESARHLAGSGRGTWHGLLSGYWQSGGLAVEGALEPTMIFAQALLQPYAHALAEGLMSGAPAVGAQTCPRCSAKPIAGVLRNESHGAKRYLLCSLCLTEWEYPRGRCPLCAEQAFEALPVYTSDVFEHIRVNACDTCRTYIKTVDLTKDGHAVPEVDELAAVPLGLWADERGYRKLWPNLLGM